MSLNEILLLSASIGTSALLIPSIDKKVSDVIREERFHKSSIINGIMKGGDIWGGGGAIAVAGLLYVLDNKELGMATLKATVLGGALARGITVITGRARPYVSPDDALNFNLFKGLDYSKAHAITRDDAL